MPEDLIAAYAALAEQGRLRHDPAQLAAVEKLEEIRLYLAESAVMRRGLFSGLLGRRNRRAHGPAPAGLYLWGEVGAGKSMLMDLFFRATDIRRKRRVHFHAFMQEVHAAIHRARQKGTRDPLVPVAREIAQGARLLCLDEMEINDITDAMLVGRLFQELFAAGTLIVTTSNRPPEDLYKDGLNRQLFLPFIALIRARMIVHHLKGATDYRRDRLKGRPSWFTPLGPQATAQLDSVWQAFCGDDPGGPLVLPVKGRQVTLPRFCRGVARAGFSRLCETPLGPGDHLAIAEAAPVLLIDDIPLLGPERHDAARRFVTLVDALYEARVRLFATAAAPPDALYPEGEGAFAFRRTASRLVEMQSADWPPAS